MQIRKPTPMESRTIVLLFVLVVQGCASGGAYSFSRGYEPLGEEEDWLEEAGSISYEELRRDPEGRKGMLVSWFGVVSELGDMKDGRIQLTFDLRRHQERHLCREVTEDSCRVTVTERSLGRFVVRTELTPEQEAGKDRVVPGSLFRVYGAFQGEFAEGGEPILQPRYLRHWPRRFYVTTSARDYMRR